MDILENFLSIFNKKNQCYVYCYVHLIITMYFAMVHKNANSNLTLS